MNLFKTDGYWFKGNIHSHTTNSDGWLSPEALAKSYSSNGYNFLAITDHWELTKIKYETTDHFILIPGTELNGGDNGVADYHFVGLGIEKKIDSKKTNLETYTPQDMIDMITNVGGLAILAHPSWNGVTYNDILPLTNLLGVEIYNTGCDLEIARGFSETQIDDLLARNKKILCFAVDDCHRIYYDVFKGWICVKAKELTAKAILEAIKEGSFYSSMGPVIYDITLHKTYVQVVSSPAKRINLVTMPRAGHVIAAREGEFLSDVKIPIRKDIKYFRIEVIDSVGRKAWSNPFYL